MMTKLPYGLKDFFNERLSDPLLSSFFGFFIIENWRPISVLLFDSLSLKDRIIYVWVIYSFPVNATLGYQELFESLAWNFGLPLCSTLAFVFAYPYLRTRIVRFSETRKKDAMNAKLKAMNLVACSSDEASAIRGQLAEATRTLESVREEQVSNHLRHDMKSLAIIGLANKHGLQEDHVLILRMDPMDVSRIQPGTWVLNQKARLGFAKIADKSFDQSEINQWCFVLERIDDVFVGVQRNGIVDFTRDLEFLNSDLPENSLVLISLTNPGTITAVSREEFQKNDAWRIVGETEEKNRVKFISAELIATGVYVAKLNAIKKM